MKTKKLDKRAKEMAKQALEFAMDNGLMFNYSGTSNGLYFINLKTKKISTEFTYLDWENREERFKKMM